MELDSLSSGTPVNEVARNVALGIGASFVASGFIAWGLLQGKEIIVSIGDWIREANARRRQRWRQEAIEEGYNLGYTDAQQGKPPQPPGSSDKDGRGAPEADDDGRGGDQ